MRRRGSGGRQGRGKMAGEDATSRRTDESRWGGEGTLGTQGTEGAGRGRNLNKDSMERTEKTANFRESLYC